MQPSRRTFLAGAAATVGATAAGLRSKAPRRNRRAIEHAVSGAFPSIPVVAPLARGVDRRWIGPAWFGNRFCDWRLQAGRIESVSHTGVSGLRTLALLTADVPVGSASVYLSVTTGLITAGIGFSGVLLGAGAGALPYKAAALVQRASGTGGGFLCCYEQDGSIRFREHTSEARPADLAVIAATTLIAPIRSRSTNEVVELRIAIEPNGTGRVDVTATAIDTRNGQVLASAVRRQIPRLQVTGGISLADLARGNDARHWFGDLRAGGAGLLRHPERTFGPIAGTLFTLSEGVLKMTVQLMPIGAAEPRTVLLQVNTGGVWITRASAVADAQGAAHLRARGWNATRAWAYQVVVGNGTASASAYGGTVPAEPSGSSAYRIGVVSCTSHMARPADPPDAWTAPLVAGERFPGRWTDVNVFFPYAPSVKAIRAQQPDLVVFNGDQYYETVPTAAVRAPAADAIEDVWHRVLLWHWAFHDLTRDRPTVVLLDDHDVYHANLWGWAGRPTVDANTGGYLMPPGWVNAVQAMLCGHLPDPFDPTPVAQGIEVTYTSFRHGPVSFAVLEDRKFKTGDKDDRAPDGTTYRPETLKLLGSRQDDFLDWWANQHRGFVKICLHQSPFVCMKTGPAGDLRRDDDTNGYPALGRRWALLRLRKAGAVLVSGDQHLGAVVHHGVDATADGPWEFAAPALGTLFQRWFEPHPPLPRSGSHPGTGDLTDPFGNHAHVQAVAGPVVAFSTVAAARPGSQLVPDRHLKRDGYAMVVVNRPAGTVTFECWPEDGTANGQYPGWPVTVPIPIPSS